MSEFVIVGAHALAFHGAPRFTGDLDILVRPTAENGRRVLDRGVLVRDVGLAGWLRVTAGTRAESDAFLTAMKEVL